MRTILVLSALVLLSACSARSCRSQGSPGLSSASNQSTSASGSSALPFEETFGVVRAIPESYETIIREVNPKRERPYEGKVATLRGKVFLRGDVPSETAHAFTGNCTSAKDVYGKLFRVDSQGRLADALVAVTGYSGFIPARAEAVKTTIHGCAFQRHTIVATFGQRIEVSNLDKKESFVPVLDGALVKAMMVAVPDGSPVKLYPQNPGHYLLRDEMKHPYLSADVYVLKYPTATVTDLEGAYEITGIPVGKVNVNAFLPSIRKTTEKQTELHEGDNELDLTIEWKKETHSTSSQKSQNK